MPALLLPAAQIGYRCPDLAGVPASLRSCNPSASHWPVARPLHLWPLSFSEIRQRPCAALSVLGVKALPAARVVDADLFDLLWREQYPRVHAGAVPPHDW